MKVAILTLGCRTNQSESATIEGTLANNGVSIVGLNELPDVCIINTCTVTAKSDYQSRQLIRRAARTGARVVVTGCYAQLRSSAVTGMEGVTDVVDIAQKSSIPELLLGYQTAPAYSADSRARPNVKVQDGCSRRCSYCAVPLARGSSRSVQVADAVRQVREVAAQGFQEIVLTGIHIGSYGRDLASRPSLADLIKALLQETDIPRIRLSSIEATEIGKDIIELIRNPRICRHLHIPLQSGSDNVLRRMRRGYATKHFIDTLHAVRAISDDIAIGTDIIAGFPGESEADFLNTAEILKNSSVSFAHVFPYSRRPGTEAASLPDQISATDISRRVRELLSVAANKRISFLSRQIGRDHEVVVEREIPGGWEGTTSNYLKVTVKGEGIRPRSLILCRPLGLSGDTIEASLIQKL